MSEIRVNTIVAAEGISAPTLPYGAQIPTGMGITGAGGLNITGIVTATFGGNVNTGLAATIGGITKVSNTTASTSTSTGALIVSGGAGFGGDVYIGAGLSVAGTVTYQDVTEVDAVGLITAQSGVNISGGQLQVGVAYSVGNAGVATAAGFVGPLTGAVTGNADTATTATTATNVTVADESSDTTCFPTFVTAATGNLPPKSGSNLTFNSSSGLLSASLLGGTINDAAQTNITSVGSLSALTVTGDLTLDNGSDAGKDLTWDVSADALIFNDAVYAKFGSDSDFSINHDGSNAYLTNTTGNLYIQGKSSENAILITPDGGTDLYHDGNTRLQTTNDGVNITGLTTVTTGAHFQGMLREDCNIVANKLSAGTNIDLSNGMVHYYSTNETTTATPNIRWSSTYSLNNKMSVGEVITVTIIYKPNGAGYYAQLTIDGSASTEEWNGGSAPSSANAGGYDVLTHTIIKTGSGSWINLANVQNYA